jgi:uncharacterized protein YukE
MSEAQVAGIEMPQGEPGAVLDAVNRLDRMASGFEQSAQGFRRAASAVPSWLGFASAAFQGLAGSLEQTADQAHAAIRDARIATRRYAEELREARRRVRRLQERAEELEQQIEEAKRRAADAARRELEARGRAAAAMLSAPLEGPGLGAALDAAAAAFDEADAAAAERRRWEDRITELEDELERVRREARQERDEVRRAESRAAAEIEQALSYFPQVESAGGTMTRQELIQGGHVLPPGKLTSEEAETFLDAYSREHGTTFSAMDRLSLMAMLTQGERPPDMNKLQRLYEEPEWSKTGNELLDAAIAVEMSLGPPGRVAATLTGGPRQLARILAAARIGTTIGRPLGVAERSAAKLWQDGLKTRPTPTSKPHGQYEVRQTGPLNYEMHGRESKIWADGFRSDDAIILEAKHVGNADRSPYVLDSAVSESKRAQILGKVEDEILRYRDVIEDSRTAARGLEIVTNEPRAVRTFQQLLEKHDVPGRVVVRP